MNNLRRRVEPAVRLTQHGLPGRIIGRLIEVQFLDRAVILAAQAFSAVLPLFIVVSTISPHPGGDSPATVLASKLGLGASETSSLQSGVVPPSSARASIGILGVVLALLTATSFARALQRSYQLAWRLPPVGIRAAWRPLALVLGLALYVELLFLFGRLVRGVPAGSALEDLVTFARGLGIVDRRRVDPARGPGQAAAAHRRGAVDRGRLRGAAPPVRLLPAQPGG